MFILWLHGTIAYTLYAYTVQKVGASLPPLDLAFPFHCDRVDRAPSNPITIPSRTFNDCRP